MIISSRVKSKPWISPLSNLVLSSTNKPDLSINESSKISSDVCFAFIKPSVALIVVEDDNTNVNTNRINDAQNSFSQCYCFYICNNANSKTSNHDKYHALQTTIFNNTNNNNVRFILLNSLEEMYQQVHIILKNEMNVEKKKKQEKYFGKMLKTLIISSNTTTTTTNNNSSSSNKECTQLAKDITTTTLLKIGCNENNINYIINRIPGMTMMQIIRAAMSNDSNCVSHSNGDDNLDSLLQSLDQVSFNRIASFFNQHDQQLYEQH